MAKSCKFASENIKGFILMAAIVLNVTDESMLTQIKKACSLLKGVSSVKVVKSSVDSHDITKTKGFREAMDDIEKGRVYRAENAEDMFKQILGHV